MFPAPGHAGPVDEFVGCFSGAECGLGGDGAHGGRWWCGLGGKVDGWGSLGLVGGVEDRILDACVYCTQPVTTDPHVHWQIGYVTRLDNMSLLLSDGIYPGYVIAVQISLN